MTISRSAARHHGTTSRIVVALVSVLTSSSALAAQSICAPNMPCPPVHESRPGARTGAWARATALNAAIGGATSGLFALARGYPVLPAIGKGMAGGTVAFAGRAISGQDGSGAGFVGREVSAVGASMIANASDGRGILSRVALPLGPITLHIEHDSTTSLRAAVDVLATIFTAYAIAHPDFSFDWSASMSAGVPVFHAPTVQEDRNWRGGMVAGTILLRFDRDHPEWRQIRAHEQVHIGQHDLSARIWGEPLEAWLLGLLPRGDRVARHTDLGLDFLLWAGLHFLVSDHRAVPWEREARLLAGQ
jgi:hypothetical protein